MENYEDGPMRECREKILRLFSYFMTRVANLDELASVGHRFLVGFQQGLEYVQRPSIEKKSELVERIIRANETKRLVSYFEAGCKTTSDSIRNVNKQVHECHHGLQDHKAKAKLLVDELACLLHDAADVVQNANYSLPRTLDTDINHNFDLGATSTEQGEVSFCALKPEVTEIATMMAVIFAMVKKDYVMQEKIISSLNIKSSSEELESYCLMWSLHPFVVDEIMQKAWKLVH